MLRTLILFMHGVVIALVGAVVYWGLEVLLVNCTDYDRGMWEGAVVVTVIGELLRRERDYLTTLPLRGRQRRGEDHEIFEENLTRNRSQG